MYNSSISPEYYQQAERRIDLSFIFDRVRVNHVHYSIPYFIIFILVQKAVSRYSSLIIKLLTKHCRQIDKYCQMKTKIFPFVVCGHRISCDVEESVLVAGEYQLYSYVDFCLFSEMMICPGLPISLFFLCCWNIRFHSTTQFILSIWTTQSIEREQLNQHNCAAWNYQDNMNTSSYEYFLLHALILLHSCFLLLINLLFMRSIGNNRILNKINFSSIFLIKSLNYASFLNNQVDSGQLRAISARLLARNFHPSRAR